jgi:hypothetical protein
MITNYIDLSLLEVPKVEPRHEERSGITQQHSSDLNHTLLVESAKRHAKGIEPYIHILYCRLSIFLIYFLFLNHYLLSTIYFLLVALAFCIYCFISSVFVEQLVQEGSFERQSFQTNS